MLDHGVSNHMIQWNLYSEHLGTDQPRVVRGPDFRSKKMLPQTLVFRIFKKITLILAEVAIVPWISKPLVYGQ